MPIGIQGDLIWIESFGGIGGWTHTPESEMLTRRLEIDDYYMEFENDSLVFESQYDLIITEDYQGFTTEKTFMKFESGEVLGITFGTNDLKLTELCYDCFTHFYARK